MIETPQGGPVERGVMIMKTNKELRRNCALLTLVLIILCPMGPPFERQQESSGSELTPSSLVLRLGWRQKQQQQQPGFPSILAQAVFLEEVAQMSVAMNQFVDALLEKLSLLAEIVIESSLREQCEASCNGLALTDGAESDSTSTTTSSVDQDDDDNNSNNNGILSTTRDSQGGHSIARPWMASTATQTGNVPPPPPSSSSSSTRAEGGGGGSILRAEHLDRREFPDDSLESLINSLGSLNNVDDTGQPPGSSIGGCKLFNLRIGRQDLPIGELEFCCSSYDLCYSRCDMSKLNCDSQFRTCLISMCKQKFDYTNETLVKAHRNLRRRQAMLEPLDEPAAEDDPMEAYDRELEAEAEAEEEEAARAQNLDELLEDENNDQRLVRGRRQLGRAEAEAEEVEMPTKRQPIQTNPRDVKVVRDKYKACKLAGKVLIIGNLAFGCQRYKDRQLRACCKLSSNDNSNNNRTKPTLPI